MIDYTTVSMYVQLAQARFLVANPNVRSRRCVMNPETYKNLYNDWRSRVPPIFRNPITGKETITIAGCKVLVTPRLGPDELHFE